MEFSAAVYDVRGRYAGVCRFGYDSEHDRFYRIASATGAAAARSAGKNAVALPANPIPDLAASGPRAARRTAKTAAEEVLSPDIVKGR